MPKLFLIKSIIFFLMALPVCAEETTTSSQPPNVLFIICDDLNDAFTGMGRVPAAVTPNIDRLRERGVTFLNGATNSPVCLPSRFSLLTGLHPHTLGHYRIYDNTWENELLKQSNTLPAFLRDNGYGTFGCGKVFHSGGVRYRNEDPALHWDSFSGGSNYGPFPWNPEADLPLKHLEIHPRQRWLANHEDLPALEAEYFDPFWMFPEEGMRFGFESGFAAIEDVPPNGWHWPDGEPFLVNSSSDRDLLEDEKSVRFAADILRREHRKPFFLAVGFIRPHTPLYVPQEYFDRYPVNEIELPVLKEDELDEVAAAHRDNRPYGRLRWEMLKPGGEQVWREWLQAYFASIAFMDDQLGKVLDALEQSAYAENTVIIFTSDHGYHMGDKFSLFKDTGWEGSIRVPLIYSGPGIASGQSCSTPASLLDTFPTILELAGIDAQPHEGSHGFGLDGTSLVPLLENPDGSTWSGPEISISAVGGLTGVHFSVRSSSHRYILCENGEEELYDHRSDPLEHHNLAAEPDSQVVKARLRRRLEGHLTRFESKRESFEPAGIAAP